MATAARRRGDGYQTWLVLLLSLNFGILFFDRQAANFMMPKIQPELGLSNFQVGMIASGLSLSWAVAGLTVGPLSDRLGTRKPILLGATMLFCMCSFLSGIAGGFAALLGARLLMGAAEGGVMPVSHAVIVAEVTPERRGLGMGVGAEPRLEPARFDGRPAGAGADRRRVRLAMGFYLAAIPGLITAGLIWLTLREPPKELAAERPCRARGQLPRGDRQPQRAAVRGDRGAAGQLPGRRVVVPAAVPASTCSITPNRRWAA